MTPVRVRSYVCCTGLKSFIYAQARDYELVGDIRNIDRAAASNARKHQIIGGVVYGRRDKVELFKAACGLGGLRAAKLKRAGLDVASVAFETNPKPEWELGAQQVKRPKATKFRKISDWEAKRGKG